MRTIGNTMALALSVALFAGGSGPLADTTPTSASAVTIYPSPDPSALTSDYTVQVQNQDVPVYKLRVAPEDPERRTKTMEDRKNTGDYYDEAAFAYFDIGGPVQVSVKCPNTVSSARLLPESFGVSPTVNGNTVTFTVIQPENLTLEVNHAVVKVLHLFANPVDPNPPSPKDPHVIYYGPGVHEATHQVVKDGQTVYIAGGAIVRAAMQPGETPVSENKRYGLKEYTPTFELRGKNIQFRGRGILDGSQIPAHAKNLLTITGDHISLGGIILQDPSIWTMPIKEATNVTVDNVKILGYRANSDGIDIVSSQDVKVQNCFIRTLDDLIVVKSDRRGVSNRIMATKNVLWNEGAHALTIGTDGHSNISNVKFVDNDVIRDLGPNYPLSANQYESGIVHGITFENIRVNQDVTVLHGGLIGMTIRKAGASADPQRGRIEAVIFKDIQATAYAPTPFPKAKNRVELIGESPTSDIEHVRFENVVINGRPLTPADIHHNRYVQAITLQP